jgi:hypothetical protein
MGAFRLPSRCARAHARRAPKRSSGFAQAGRNLHFVAPDAAPRGLIGAAIRGPSSRAHGRVGPGSALLALSGTTRRVGGRWPPVPWARFAGFPETVRTVPVHGVKCPKKGRGVSPQWCGDHKATPQRVSFAHLARSLYSSVCSAALWCISPLHPRSMGSFRRKERTPDPAAAFCPLASDPWSLASDPWPWRRPPPVL